MYVCDLVQLATFNILYHFYTQFLFNFLSGKHLFNNLNLNRTRERADILYKLYSTRVNKHAIYFYINYLLLGYFLIVHPLSAFNFIAPVVCVARCVFDMCGNSSGSSCKDYKEPTATIVSTFSLHLGHILCACARIHNMRAAQANKAPKMQSALTLSLAPSHSPSLSRLSEVDSTGFLLLFLYTFCSCRLGISSVSLCLAVAAAPPSRSP